MRRLPSSRLAWFACGFGAGAGLCLLAGGVRGALATLATAGMGAAFLASRRISEPVAALMGALAAVDVFAIWLWISPPCDLSDPTTTSLERAPDGTVTFMCEPRTGMGALVLLALAGTLAIVGLLYLRRRELSHRQLLGSGESKPTPRMRKVTAACAVASFATGAMVALPVLSVNGWSPSALVRMAKPDPIAAFALDHDPGFRLFDPEAHYDGVYFYAIGADPLARWKPHRLLDLGAHRYTHPLYGWLAWIASLGRPQFGPHALLGINLIAIAVAGGAAAHLAARLGANAWTGLLVAINPGLVAAVSFDTAEPLGAAILMLSLIAWFGRRPALGGAGFFFLCLTRQPFAVIPIALAVWELISRQRSHSLRRRLGNVAILAAGPMAMVVWQIYLYLRFDELPFATGEIVLTFPFEGWAEGLRLMALHGGSPLAQVALPSLALLAVALTGAVFVTHRALTRPSALGAIFLGLMTIYFSLEQLAIVFPKELLRYSAIPLLVAPFLYAGRSGPDASD